MPWVIRDVVDDINKAVTKRWRHLDLLLPEPSDLPEGCMPPLLGTGDNSRPSGLGRLPSPVRGRRHAGPDLGRRDQVRAEHAAARTGHPAAADDLLTQWCDHLTSQPKARKDDTAAIVNWPSRDVTGVLALLRHGLQPLTVIAVRPKARPTGPPSTSEHTARPGHPPGQPR